MSCPLCFGPLAADGLCPDPVCEAAAADFSLHDLPPGFRLNDQFQLGRPLGRGGFGITYIAWDEHLQRRDQQE